MAMGYREKGGWNVHSAQHNLVARIQDGGLHVAGVVSWSGSVDSACRTSGSIPREGAVTHDEEWAANVMESTAKYCSGSLVSRRQDERGAITHRRGPIYIECGDRGICRTL